MTTLIILCNKIVFVIEAGVEDPNFAYGLLMELTRAFLAYADNVRAQDSAAYAIQVRYNVRSLLSSQIISYHTEHSIIKYKCIFCSMFETSSCTVLNYNVKGDSGSLFFLNSLLLTCPLEFRGIAK